MNDAALLKAIIENVVDGILVIDQNGLIVLANPAAYQLFGYAPGELLNNNISMLMQTAEGKRHDEYIKRYEQGGEPGIIGIGRQVKAVKKDGTIFPARLAVSEADYKEQKVYAGIIHDLSNDKKEEEQLQQYANKLEAVVEERTGFLKSIVQTLEQAKEEVNTSLLKEREVNQLKTRFLSIASHEFRTPLSSIQLSAALIERYFDRLDKNKIFSHLHKIKSAVGNLTAILNDFLSVEKIESGNTQPVFKTFDLKDTCLGVVEEMGIQVKTGQQLKYEHAGNATSVYLDNTLLRYCLINLISNGIKYSGDDGIIKLRTEITSDEYKIAVSDNGIGIPREDQANLFEAFFRAQNSGEVQGTGLGLNIVKRYTNMLNGQVSFESTQGEGTTFKLWFPITR